MKVLPRHLDNVENLLTAADSGEPVYNVDFQDWKSSASSVFDAARKEAHNVYLHGDRSVESDSELYYEIGHYPSAVTSKKFLKLLTNSTDSAFKVALEELVEQFTPVANAIKTVNTNVIKGRKPSDNPNKTPERTLENTGTCPVCGRNIKMRDGKMVDHGFKIGYGSRHGKCFGVGYEPMEVSPKGAEDYLDSLRGVLANSEENLTSATTQKEIWNLESIIRYVTKDIEMYEGILANWEEKPLPK